MIEEYLNSYYEDDENPFSFLEDVINSGPPDPRASQTFNKFKTLLEKSKSSHGEDGVLWIVYLSFLGTMFALGQAGSSAGAIDDFEARLSFIEKDIGNFKRILKRLNKTTK